MDDLQAAYEKYLEAFPLRYDPARNTPKSFEEFPFYYTHAKISRSFYDEQLCKGMMNPVGYFSMTVFDIYLGIVHTAEERRDAFQNGFSFVDKH